MVCQHVVHLKQIDFSIGNYYDNGLVLEFAFRDERPEIIVMVSVIAAGDLVLL
jgi:hypothetical protein